MASLGSLVISLAADTARLSSDMGKAVGIAERSARAMQTAFKFAGGGLLGASVLNIAKQSIELGDSLSKAAVKAGVSGQAISQLAYAAKQADIDIGSLSGALQKMQVALSKAASGGKEQNNTLAALGLRIEEIKQLAPDKQFELLADRISQLKDPADRARAAVELFGKSGAELLPLFEQGAEGIRKAREEAVRIGASLSDDAIKKLAETDDAVKKLSQSWENFAAKMVSYVGPSITTVLNELSGADRVSDLRREIERLEKGPSSGFQAYGIGFYDEKQREQQLALLRRQLAIAEGRSFRGNAAARGITAAAPVGFENVADRAAQAAREIGKVFEQEPYEFNLEIDPADLEATRGDFIDSFDDIAQTARDAAENVSDAFNAATSDMSVFADQAARNMTDAFAEFFKNGADGAQGFAKSMIDALRSILANKAAQELADYFASFSKTGSRSEKGGILGDILGGIFGGKREAGGPVSSGRAYLVGERGPELFMPRGSGTIIPNGRMGGAAVVIAPTYNIDARGASTDLVAALPEILKRNDAQLEAKIVAGLRRRKYAL